MGDSALLALADGSLFRGVSIGVAGEAVGEVVFNTSITGYQEILTDPSYCRQLITFTQPQIGNTGVNPEDAESAQIHAGGLIIKQLPVMFGSWRAHSSLGDYLAANNIVAIANVDTRRLTRLLRRNGAQSGCIMAGDAIDAAHALEQARAFPGLHGMDLAREVTTGETYRWQEGVWSPAAGRAATPAAPRHKVTVYDFGVKRNMLRILTSLGCELEVVAATTSAADVLAQRPDGIFLSNGPGDPEPCDYAIAAIRELLAADLPVFGICLGHQLLALACGGATVKMKFGHHGGNHPVQELATGKVMITSQNHGFTVAEDTLPDTLSISHRSLFDGTVQGLAHTERPAFGFQGHPEASPGPHDLLPLFARFTDLMERHRCAQ